MTLIMAFTSFLFILLLSVILVNVSSAMWCTRLRRVTHVESYVVLTQCTKAYKAKCGWFTSNECTYYELVECPVEKNKTLEKYMIVEECCPGYELDPINNITCIKTHSEGVHYYDAAKDNTFLELSHGVYAGIFCTTIFVLCVSILIVIHILKRKRNAKLKSDVVKLEMDVNEKMIPAHT